MHTWIRLHKRTWRWLLTAGVALAAGGLARAGAPVLKPGARLAFVGDSITAQKLYTTYIEAYLLACRPELKVSVIQLGWGGEVAPGFLARMDGDLLPWRPDAVTVCYGMNDGRYRRYSEETGATYRQAMEGIVSGIKAAGAVAVVGGPGVVDTRYFQQGDMADAATIAKMLREANEYNDTLGKLSELAQQVAAGNGMPFADVHGVMAAAMPKAKAAYGDEYAIAPGGVHPSNNGHLLMAYAFLKALGVEGPIGTITAQWGGKAVATSGHTVRAFTNGVLEMESSRYPFCVTGPSAGSTNFSDAAGADAWPYAWTEMTPLGAKGQPAASMLPFVPFEEEFNRFVLVVKGLPSEKAEVKWGGEAKVFTREQLAAGVNLAEAFPNNPFCPAFEKLVTAVYRKQMIETENVCKTFADQRKEIAKNPTRREEVLRQRDKLLLADQAQQVKAVRALVKPLCHQLAIRPLQQ